MEVMFNNVSTSLNSLEIEHPGDCAIEAYNERKEYYYLVIKTLLGITTIAECGPVVPDVTLLPDKYTTKLTRVDYDLKKLTLIIKKWINDFHKGIVEATCISHEEALIQFRDLGKYMAEISDEVY